jgi:hypothetical protein
LNQPTTLNAGQWPSAEPSQQKVSGHPRRFNAFYAEPVAAASPYNPIQQALGAGLAGLSLYKGLQ